MQEVCLFDTFKNYYIINNCIDKFNKIECLYFIHPIIFILMCDIKTI